MRRLLLLSLLLICLRPSGAGASLRNGVAGLADRAAGRSVNVASFADLTWPHGMDFSLWNSFGGSQNYYPIGAAARGDYAWIAALCRLERSEGIFGTEQGSPGFYFSEVVYAKMVALRDARLDGREDLAADIAADLRAVWSFDALIALETPRTSSWADLGGDGIVTGVGNAADYQGLTVPIAGNRWNGDDHGARWLNGDDHSGLLSWALDWSPRRSSNGGVLRNPHHGMGNVVGFLGGVDRYEDPIAPEIFGITTDEREVLRRVVRGDVGAAETVAGWLGDFGTLAKWRFTLTRTSHGTQTIFWGPYPNPNKPAHAATSITTGGAWRTIRPSPWGRRAGMTAWDFDVRIEGDEIVASVRDTPPVRMPVLDGDLIWEVTLQGHDLNFRSAQEQDPSAGHHGHDHAGGERMTP